MELGTLAGSAGSQGLKSRRNASREDSMREKNSEKKVRGILALMCLAIFVLSTIYYGLSDQILSETQVFSDLDSLVPAFLVGIAVILIASSDDKHGIKSLVFTVLSFLGIAMLSLLIQRTYVHIVAQMVVALALLPFPFLRSSSARFPCTALFRALSLVFYLFSQLFILSQMPHQALLFVSHGSCFVLLGFSLFCFLFILINGALRSDRRLRFNGPEPIVALLTSYSLLCIVASLPILDPMQMLPLSCTVLTMALVLMLTYGLSAYRFSKVFVFSLLLLSAGFTASCLFRAELGNALAQRQNNFLAENNSVPLGNTSLNIPSVNRGGSPITKADNEAYNESNSNGSNQGTPDDNRNSTTNTRDNPVHGKKKYLINRKNAFFNKPIKRKHVSLVKAMNTPDSTTATTPGKSPARPGALYPQVTGRGKYFYSLDSTEIGGKEIFNPLRRDDTEQPPKRTSGDSPSNTKARTKTHAPDMRGTVKQPSRENQDAARDPNAGQPSSASWRRSGPQNVSEARDSHCNNETYCGTKNAKHRPLKGS
jgi:hypothetical protein